NEQRVKVLPVRFRGAGMPPILQDTFWGDADRDDVETLERRLAAAVRANLQGREADAAREAERAQQAAGAPAHEERSGDVAVAQIDAVAERVWDVFDAAVRVWRGRGNVGDLDGPQRKLRWALDGLPDRVRAALPLVEQLAMAEWDEFFGDPELLDVVERDF